MNEFYSKAVEKLGADVTGQRERIMAPLVRQTLTDFCRQDAEFAQAVAQGGSFQGCMQAVAAKARGGGISDIDAFRAAAAYYFPGSQVEMQLVIRVNPFVSAPAAEPNPVAPGIVLNFSDFF